LRDLTGWQWAGLSAVGVFLLLVWQHFANDPGDVSWTDPQQPPAMVPPLMGASSGRTLRGCPYSRSYPGSLGAWDGTVVGDC
jgi:hypothetical protein